MYTRALLASLLCGAAAGCGGSAGEIDEPSLLVLISLDTLRADRLETYGYGRATAPHLAALAADGVVFERCFAQAAQTLTSHKSLFLSKYPLHIVRDGTRAGLAELAALPNPLEFLVGAFTQSRGSLVASLAAAGFETAAFTDGGYMTRTFGMDEGFATFVDAGGGFAEILPRVERWIDGRDEGPAFLFLHSYDVHCPYACEEPENSRFCPSHDGHVDLSAWCGKQGLDYVSANERDRQAVLDHYDGGVALADAYLGRFLEGLKRRGLYDDALIVVTSDHGESLFEHGQVGHGSLYLEQLQVPLVVKFPRAWELGGRRASEAVELVDVLPTLLEAVGVAAPPELDGRSLLSILLRGEAGRSQVLAQSVFQEPPRFETSLVKRSLLEPGRFQVIHDAGSDDVEFFDLAADPHALADASRDAPVDLPRALEALLRRDDRAGAGEVLQPDRVQIDEALERALNHLGYGGAGTPAHKR